MKLLFRIDLRQHNDEVIRLTQNVATNTDNITMLAEIKKHIAALQAVDVSFMGYGHIIIIARIGKQDIVKIIDVKREINMKEYITLSKHLESVYGAKAQFFDAPTSSIWLR